MKPNFAALVGLMEHLSEVKCNELCQKIVIGSFPDADLAHPAAQKLDNSKMSLLQKELKATPVEKTISMKEQLQRMQKMASAESITSPALSDSLSFDNVISPLSKP